jgi:subtilisin family serine protease
MNIKKCFMKYIFIMAIMVTFAFSQSRELSFEGKKYIQKGEKWYTFEEEEVGDEIIPDRLIVKLKTNGNVNEFEFGRHGISGVSIASSRYLDGFYVLSIDSNTDPFEIAKSLESSKLFQIVEFDVYGTRNIAPSDYYYSNQWNLTKIEMTKAWGISTGDSSQILAIIDSGIDYDHEDLDGNYWVNPDEDYNENGQADFTSIALDGDLDGVDDDSNGKIDDLIGWDFTEPDNIPDDEDGHGTMVSGIPCAQTHNYESGSYKGIAGLAGGWGSKKGVRIMTLKDGEGDAIASNTIQAILYAASMGAKTINISSSFTSEPSGLSTAIDSAVNSYGVVVVASAGNNGDDLDPSIFYPARYSNTLCVGASDASDERRLYSAYGQQMDVVAPDVVYSTTYDGGYINNAFGTSYSSPTVAGLAALIRSVKSSLTWQQVRTIIRDNADKVPEMDDNNFTNYYGYGRINAYKALKYTLEYYGGTLTQDISIGSGDTLSFKSGATVNLNSYSIKSTGGVLQIDEEATISPDIRLMSGSNISGIYSSLDSAYAAGSVVEVRGTHTFTDNVTIASGKTLKPKDEAELKFPSGKYLNVSGALTCDKATFTRTSGTWGGIKYLENSTGTLDEATITNATYGVYCNEASPTIMYSDISNCTYGIYNNDASPTISGNDISGSTYDIYCYDSSPIIKNNDISGGAISLYCDHYSSPELLTGGNDFHNGYVTFGVWADDISNPNLGNDGCSLPGNHSFEYTMYDIAIVHAGTNCSISAEKNWWGTSSPNGGEFSGTVDWNPYLGSAPAQLAPNPEGNMFDQNMNFASIAPDDNGDKLINYYNEDWPLDLKIDFLRYLAKNDEVLGVPALCKDIIESYPYAPEAFLALDIIYQITKKENIVKDIDKESMKTYLKTFEGVKGNKMLNGSALLMLAGLEKGEGLSRIDAVYAANKDNYLGPYALYQKFMYYYHDADDLGKAKGVLAQLDEVYPDDRVTFEAHLLMGDNEVDAKTFYSEYYKKETPDVDLISTDIEEIIPKEYSLKAAYPNPFNPSTTLEYTLPIQSEVECSIFDLSGNIVKEFFFNQYAGTHSVTWNADQFPSGIYLVRFVAESVDGTNSFVDYQKVTLLK